MPSLCRGRKKRKKRLIRLQVRPHRAWLAGLITPVRKYLRGVSVVVGSSDLFAARRDDLCGQLHVVYPGRYSYSCSSVSAVFTCREKA
jgi:hypothetical protein